MSLKTIISKIKQNKKIVLSFLAVPKIPIILLIGYINSASGCTESSAIENPTPRIESVCAEYRGYRFDGDSTSISYLDSNGEKITLSYNGFEDPNELNVGENYSFEIKEGPVLGRRITNIENCVN